MHKIGLLCGLSWVSTKIYYESINTYIANHMGGLNSAKLIMNNVNNLEFVELVESKQYKKVEQRLLEEIKIIEDSGALCVGLTCNTLHYFLDNIRDKINIPVIHILDSVTNKLIEHNDNLNIKKTGVLATKYSVNLNLHKKYLNKIGMEILYPTEHECEYINQAIFKVCSGENNYKIQSEVSNILDRLINHGCDAIVLGCTELGLIVNADYYDIPVLDTALIHSEDIAKFALGSNNHLVTTLHLDNLVHI